MKIPDHSSNTPSDFFEDLQRRREAKEELTEAEENYCLALEAGYDTYVADLAYMQADNQNLSIGEEIYLEARFQNWSGEEVEEMAAKATEEFAARSIECIDDPSVQWGQAVEEFREEFFNTPGKKAFEQVKAAGLDDLTADLAAQKAEGVELSPGDLAYLNARIGGHSEYVAELLSKKANSNLKIPEEIAYLEAKLQGFSDEQADLVAESVKNKVSQVLSRIKLGIHDNPLN